MELRIASYNVKGLGPGKMKYIESLTQSHDLIFIQEHWQMPSLLSVFADSIPGIAAHGVSAMSDHELLRGRPHGGVAILWRSSLQICISPIPCRSPRICAIKATLTTGEHLFLAVNVYMPTDAAENSTSYDDVLQEISALLEAESVDQILVGGDWNTDFSRQSQHTM